MKVLVYTHVLCCTKQCRFLRMYLNAPWSPCPRLQRRPKQRPNKWYQTVVLTPSISWSTGTSLQQPNLTPGSDTQHIVPTIFSYNITCTSRSWCQIRWKIGLWNYLWLQKVWIVLHRSPVGIAVWDSSPNFPLPRRPPSVLTVCSAKAGQLSNPWMHLLPADRLTLCTLIFVAVSHVYKEWGGGRVDYSAVIWKMEKQTRPLMLRSGWGRFILACVLSPNQLMNLQCAALYCDWRWRRRMLGWSSLPSAVIGDASWVFSTCPCSL